MRGLVRAQAAGERGAAGVQVIRHGVVGEDRGLLEPEGAAERVGLALDLRGGDGGPREGERPGREQDGVAAPHTNGSRAGGRPSSTRLVARARAQSASSPATTPRSAGSESLGSMST